MTINDVDTSRLPAKQEEVKTPEPVAAPVVQELETTAVGDILGLNKEEMGKYHDKIDTLLEWANALPITPPIATNVSALDVWTTPISTVTGTGTTGAKLNTLKNAGLLIGGTIID